MIIVLVGCGYAYSILVEWICHWHPHSFAGIFVL
jgi:hypothetical protein